MNWEAFATPPAPISAAYRKYARSLYTMHKPKHEVRITYHLAAADETYFDAIGGGHNTLDRKVHAR